MKWLRAAPQSISRTNSRLQPLLKRSGPCWSIPKHGPVSTLASKTFVCLTEVGRCTLARASKPIWPGKTYSRPCRNSNLSHASPGAASRKLREFQGLSRLDHHTQAEGCHLWTQETMHGPHWIELAKKAPARILAHTLEASCGSRQSRGHNSGRRDILGFCASDRPDVPPSWLVYARWSSPTRDGCRASRRARHLMQSWGTSLLRRCQYLDGFLAACTVFLGLR